MSFSLYEISVPQTQKALASLTDIIKAGEASPAGDSLLEARIYADMLPLNFQVHLVTDIALKIVARLSGLEPPTTKLEDLKTFADVHARIEQAQKALKDADKALIDSRVAESVPLGLGPGRNITLPGVAYLNGYALPNIYFHLTTAYNILRKEGVPVGKMHYLTPFIVEYVPKELQ